jgi:hypothetical protein
MHFASSAFKHPFVDTLLAISEAIGERREQAINIWKLALATEVCGDRYSSIDHAELALSIFNEIGGRPTDLIREKIEGWKVIRDLRDYVK